MLAPALCPGCDALLDPEERLWCRKCRSTVDPAPLPSEIIASLYERFDCAALALSGVAALMRYDEGSLARRLLHSVKYQGATTLGVELGKTLARYLGLFPALFDRIDVIVPVPVHPARRRERGYNQAQCIAAGLLAEGVGCEIIAALQRVRHGRSQTSLGAAARQTNIAGAFTAASTARRIVNQSVLLCDDVLTTGATLNTCAELLLAMGATRVVAATVARDEPIADRDDSLEVFFSRR